MRIFMAAPFTGYIGPDGLVTAEGRKVLSGIKSRLESFGSVFLAHEREAWGGRLMPPEVCVPADFEEMLAADLVFLYPGDPPSPGVCVEAGWAVALDKPMIIYVPGRSAGGEASRVSPMLRGLKYVGRAAEIETLDELPSAVRQLTSEPESRRGVSR